MFKDLLVATTGQGDDAAALSNACALAEAVDGHVSVLVQDRVSIASGGALSSFAAEALIAAYDRVRQRAEADCERWRESLRRSGVSGEVRLVIEALAKPAQTAAQQARYADLTFVGLGERETLPGMVHDEIASLLSGSGRPLFVVPHGCAPVAFRRIAIAWRPSANAARAVHDALPFLAGATAIDVLCIDPHRSEGEHGDDPGVDIARHLARHGFSVTVHVESGAGDEPGEVLLRRCRELGADLLVMGGYSHSRLREWAFGGTTRYVLKNATIAALMAH